MPVLLRIGRDRRTTDGGITDHEQFKVVCLNKEVLYTALVTMKSVRGDPLRLPLVHRYGIKLLIDILSIGHTRDLEGNSKSYTLLCCISHTQGIP